MFNIEEIPLDDKDTWDMICEGRVKGCFQIESQLGKTWCKEVKPRNILELSDVISIVRPGVLKFVYDGKSMAKHYADRKSKVDEATPLHPILGNLLSDTYQVLLYQEQIMKIASVVAGFNEKSVNSLRKNVSKKNAKELFALEEQFVSGCVKTSNLKEEEAKLIFDNVKKSARYLFCKSVCPETTYVEKANGESCRMRDVDIGDSIKTPTGYSKVIDKMDHGVLDVFEIGLDNGKTIRCTVNHKFLCTSGEILPLWQILFLGKDIISE